MPCFRRFMQWGGALVIGAPGLSSFLVMIYLMYTYLYSTCILKRNFGKGIISISRCTAEEVLLKLLKQYFLGYS